MALQRSTAANVHGTVVGEAQVQGTITDDCLRPPEDVHGPSEGNDIDLEVFSWPDTITGYYFWPLEDAQGTFERNYIDLEVSSWPPDGRTVNFTKRTQPCAAGVHGTYRVQWTARGTQQPFGPRTGPTLCTSEWVGGPAWVWAVDWRAHYPYLWGGWLGISRPCCCWARAIGWACCLRSHRRWDHCYTLSCCCWAWVFRWDSEPMGSTAAGAADPAAGCGVGWWACPIEGMDPDGTSGACNVRVPNRWARILYTDPNVLCPVIVGNRQIAQTKKQILRYFR